MNISIEENLTASYYNSDNLIEHHMVSLIYVDHQAGKPEHTDHLNKKCFFFGHTLSLQLPSNRLGLMLYYTFKINQLCTHFIVYMKTRFSF